MPYKTGIRLLGVARNPANGFPARLLGPAYPQERLNFIIEDAKIQVLVTSHHLLGSLHQPKCRIVCLDYNQEAFANESKKNPVSGTTPDNLEVWPESHWPGFALRQADVFQSYTAW